MKVIHIPTLFLHGGLLVLAGLMLNDYSDGFLLIAGLVLIGHVVLTCVSRRSLSLTHLLGCGFQYLIFRFGLITVGSGAFGLGGGGFALFFYQLALGATALMEVLIDLFKYRRNRDHPPI